MPRVYPILDTLATERANCNPADAARAMLEGGASILQFRHKRFWDACTVDLAGEIAELCRRSGAIFIINDRADYAALHRSGLHLGQDDLSPADARRVVGPNAIVGYSTHNPEQLTLAESEDLDYVAFGPVFATASKERPDPTVGLELLRLARTLTAKPLVAIGGISRETAPSVWEAGADSIALISDLLPAPCTLPAIAARVREWCALAR